MANSLASLKQLQCPEGDSCTAFQCLFKHDRDRAEESSTKRRDTHLDAGADAPPESAEEGPRKRPKLARDEQGELGHRDAAGVPETDKNGSKSTVLSKGVGDVPSHIKPSPATQPSSSPLSHRVQSLSEKAKEKSMSPVQGNKPMTQTTKPKAAASSPSKAPGTPNAAAAAKAEPKKPETLNPRLLKKSPARHEVRFKLLKTLHEQYARLNNELKKDPNNKGSNLLLSDQELIVRALDEEEDTAIKKGPVYPMSMKNRIMTYKRMSPADWKEERTKALQEASREAAGAKQPDPSPEPIVTGLTNAQEVEFLKRLVKPLDELQQHGYVTSIPTEEEIQKAREAVEASGNIEACERCSRRFQVFPGRRPEDGALASNGSCTFHPGKTYFGDRPPGDRSRGPRKYRCCHQNVDDKEAESAAGCTTTATHVFKTTDPKRLAALLNFAATPPNPGVPADRAVAFDCEMGYTVHGLELIRLTAVSWPDGAELIDVLVQPYGETLDLNSRYSGVRPEDMLRAERWKPGDPGSAAPALLPDPDDPAKPPQRRLKLLPSPKAARDLLFSFLAPETPLLGHGTENDLNATRVVHPTVVDTVLLYPHRRGLPVRHGLKHLMEAYLDRKIQMDALDADGVPTGHDSAEDARAAGELVRLRVREEWRKLRMLGWTLSETGGGFVPPGDEDGWTLVGGGGKKGAK